ncbi:hypothetical protein IQ244_17560 [Nostoc sp. LEGE 06077]|nr:hypothetical protein [Nostoc sp. LEGE 06077]MBE9208301.1 hypothetical protein [Nostoc sp. LEGE 06077]
MNFPDIELKQQKFIPTLIYQVRCWDELRSLTQSRYQAIINDRKRL